MDGQGVTATAISGVSRLSDELGRFAKLERNLGVLLLFAPLVLILFDDGPDGVRDSISAYHDVSTPEAFYVPLTVGAMLFFVNGFVRHAHVYNVVLGLALLGVVLFDHEGPSALHTVCAIAFFGGNVAVMMFFSTNKSKRLKVIFVAVLAAAGALWALTSLFWAEWVSLGIIAVHFILDSTSWSPYEALPAGEAPKLVPPG